MEKLAHIGSNTSSKDTRRELERKIRNRSAKLGVIGLGYAGLHLAMQMAGQRFHVTAIDLDSGKVDSINNGISYVMDLKNEQLHSAISAGSIRATQSFASVESVDAVSICVPTPVRKNKDVDLSYLIAAVEAVHNHLKPAKLVTIESTVLPGTTREIILPILQKSGLQAGRDFFLAYAPKRMHSANKVFARRIPKVVGGVSSSCTALAGLLYHQMSKHILTVSSLESAEMVSFMEATFHTVNTALGNEMAQLCHNVNVDVGEITAIAKSNVMPFSPGPGTLEEGTLATPNSLRLNSEVNGRKPVLLKVAEMLNSKIAVATSSRIVDLLRKRGKTVSGSHILALGIAQTRNTHHIRDSIALEILTFLKEQGAIISYSDPHVPSIELDGRPLVSTSITSDVLSSADCVAIFTDHSDFDYRAIVANSRLIFDCRNAVAEHHKNVIPV